MFGMSNLLVVVGLPVIVGFCSSMAVQAFDDRTEADYDGSHSICDQYGSSTRKKAICMEYDNQQIKQVGVIPEDSSDLEQGVLYVVSNPSGTVTTPYTLPANTSVISIQGKSLDLIPTGKGSDAECALCIVKLNEGSGMAGVNIDLSDTQWEPTPGPGSERAVIFGKTQASEFSEGVIKGTNGFEYLIHQKVYAVDGKAQTYSDITLYTKGSQTGIYIENTNPDGTVFEPASVDNCTVVLSDTKSEVVTGREEVRTSLPEWLMKKEIRIPCAPFSQQNTGTGKKRAHDYTSPYQFPTSSRAPTTASSDSFVRFWIGFGISVAIAVVSLAGVVVCARYCRSGCCCDDDYQRLP